MVFFRNSVFVFISIFCLKFLKQEKSYGANLLLVELSKPLGDFVSRIEFVNSLIKSESFSNIYLVADKKFKVIKHLVQECITIIFIDSFMYKINPFYKYYILVKLNSLKLGLTINISVVRGMLCDEVSLYSGAKTIMATRRGSDYMHRYFLNKNNQKYTQVLKLNSENEYERLKELSSILSLQNKIAFKHKSITTRNKTQCKYILIAPYASKKIQSWPLKNYTELIRLLAANYEIVILGNNNVCSDKFDIPKKNNIKNLISKTDLSQADEYIKNCSLFIGNDSGLTHLALFHNVPLVGIIGGGNFGQFFPYSNQNKNMFLFHSLECFNCKWKCKYPESFCLTRITVEQVYLTVEKLKLSQ